MGRLRVPALDLARGELHDLLEECDLTFHLAAEPGVRASWGSRFEAYLRNNVLATQHMLDAARDHPGKRFVYASSSSIYGQAERFPTPEDTQPRAAVAIRGHQVGRRASLWAYNVNHGVETVCLRYFTVFGPRQRLFGDGEQTRDFTFVGDVVEVTRAAGTAAIVVGGIYNIGGGFQISINQALAAVSELAGRQLEVEYVERAHGDVRDTGADTTRARRDLGFRPRTPSRTASGRSSSGCSERRTTSA